jgi:DNA polymerase I-like protein with 3'-5' exonuclease and polymerase domains
MERQLEICIDRTVESMKNQIQLLQEVGRKEFQTQTTRLKNAYTKVIDNAREVIHSEEKGILLNTQVTLEQYINQCINDGEYVLDIETTGLDPFNDLIVGVCLYSPSQEPAYIPMLHTDIYNKLLPGQLEVAVVKQHITRLMESNAHWINHNIKFDAKFLMYRWNIKPNNMYWDTLIGAFVLNENEPTHGLKPLYAKYITKSKDKQSYKDLFEKTPFNYIPLDLAEVYGANDGTKTYALYKFQKQYLNPNHDRGDFKQLYKVFRDIEMALLPVLCDMELKGVEIDTKFAKELEVKYEQVALDQEQYLYDVIYTRFANKVKNHTALQELIAKQAKNKKLKGTKYQDLINFNSSPQLKYLFFDILGFPKLYRRDPMSCGKEQQQLWLDSDKVSKGQKEFLQAFMEWRKTVKLLTSFIVKIPEAREVKTNAVHTNFNQLGAKTGRFSSSHPVHKINLQQIPSRNKDIRKIFTARPGHVFIGSDFSAIEPRILATVSQDPTMLQTFNDGIDIYASMASLIFNVPYEQCLEFHPETGEKQPEGKDRRTQTKSVLLGIMYSRGAKAIAEQFGRDAKWGQELIDNFYKSFPSIKEIITRSMYQAEKLGYVCTITGRKRRLPNMRLDKENYLYQEASRQCLNARIQGSSADVMKLAMVNLYNNPRFKELGGSILMTIHDEMVIECRDEVAVEMSELLPEVMKDTAMKLLGTKQKCDVEVSRVWSGDDCLDEIKCSE